jgi:hypothetical protein
LAAALERAVPADVREGRREPTDREKMAQSFILVLSVADNGLNDERAEKNRRNRAQVQRALDIRFKELREAVKDAPPEVREELATVERLARDTSRILDFLDRPTTFPSTRASLLDLTRRVDQIPGVLDRAAELYRDLEYHNKRLELLQEIHELAPAARNADDAGKAAREKLEANTALVAALDAQYKAQVKADRLKSPPATGPTTRPVSAAPATR